MSVMQGNTQLNDAVHAHLHGQTERAESLYRGLLAKEPQNSQAAQFFGVLLFQSGKRSEGVQWMKEAVNLNPADPEAWSNLGNALRVTGDREGAISALETALLISPTLAPAHCTLSACLRYPGTLSKAIDAARDAVRIQPQMPQAHCNLGLALLEAGEVEASIAALQQALYVAPNFLEAHQGLLFAMLYSDKHSSAEVLDQARRFGRTQPKVEWNARGELRTLAFLSSDFKNHPVAFFVKPLLAHLASGSIRVVLLSNTSAPDETTLELRHLCNEFIDVRDLTASELQSVCLEKEIDILIDLSGHTAENRIDAVSLRLAPVQVSWLGYSGTTGLPTMDWILGDGQVSPVEFEPSLTERVMRLNTSVYHCDPSCLNGELEPPPAVSNGFITFGSFNNLSKITPSCMDAWSKILAAVPDSRLVLKSRHFADPAISGKTLHQLVARGVDQSRVTLLHWNSSTTPLDDYNQIDIALDTFPYTGATTTAEALWMGVPVVTLRGDRYSSRMSASILNQLSRFELITDSKKDYIEHVVQLARDLEGLTALRSTLREQLLTSPLCDSINFAKDFEKCLLAVWSESKRANKFTGAV